MAVWFLKLRNDYKKGEISQERFDKLVAIDFPFEPNSDKWTRYHERLAEFIQKNQRLPKLDRGQDEKNIYTWLITQRSAFRKNELEKDRVDLLLMSELVNDFFQLEDGKRQMRSLRAPHKSWQDSYSKTLELLKNGDTLDKKSYNWLRNHRSFLKRGKLDLDKKQKIESLESLRKSK